MDKRKSFTKSLECHTQLNSINKSDDLLSQLGLLSKDVNASISDDGKYLELSLKESDYYKGPLKFKLPLEEQNLDAYYNHPDYEALSSRHDRYENEYFDSIVDFYEQVATHLHKKFPNLKFHLRLRLKSKASYDKKMNSRILEDKNLNISDIVAARLVIDEFHVDSPEILESMCYLVAEEIEKILPNTNISIKHIEDSANPAPSDRSCITKDFIKHPKNCDDKNNSNNDITKNNDNKKQYQSLHIVYTNKQNPDLASELQIRTFDMDEIAKKDEKVAHSSYKPRLLNDLSKQRIPKYVQITNFFNKDGTPQILKATPEEAFYHYYLVPYEVYSKELKEIQKYVNFQDIRKQLQIINKNKQEKAKEPELIH